jgi:hypothetical protein
MERDTQVQLQVFMELAGELRDAPAPAGVPVGNAELVRSEENIVRWMAYLPQDCIETMIRMGWDVTT